MSLNAGTRLGPYEITAQIGAGGMGEVYKATDTRLDRTVAIKVLPEHLASDPQRRERFEREAKAVSSLNHPHICTLHDVGEQDGTHYLVMELVDGETLEARLQKGRLPLDQALEYAIQIADALDKAHRQGVVHRDLKPGNVMVTKVGVKLLDFGLAKLKGDDAAVSPLSQMPTAEGSTPLTAEGTILGTLQYMAPEQLEGKKPDARTDIFAFGAVAYEMVTGKKAFEGGSQASLIGAIMNSEPTSMSELESMTPKMLDHLVRTCLEKDPDDRWQAVCDVYRELRWLKENAATALLDTASRAVHRMNRPVAMVALLGTALVAFALFYLNRGTLDALETRLDIATPPGSDPTSFALSPDGRNLVFVADDGEEPRLWLRSLSRDVAVPLPDTEGAFDPFWSPDSQSIAFFANAQLKTIDIDGDRSRPLASAAQPVGGSWGADDRILFSPSLAGSVFQIDAAGGEPVLVVSDPERYNYFPHFLPDGRQFLFVNAPFGPNTRRGVFLGTLDSPETRFLFEADSHAIFHSDGYLFFIREGTLFAVGFDAVRGQVIGQPSRVAEGIAARGPYRFGFSASDSGLLAYRRGGVDDLVASWFDRFGQELGTLGSGQAGEISNDGNRLAFNIGGDIWMRDVGRGVTSQFSLNPEQDVSPAWSPDDTQLVFGFFGPDGYELRLKSSNGIGGEEQLLVDGGVPHDWHDQTILYTNVVGANADLMILDLSSGETYEYVADPDHQESRGQFSPDGRWIAYDSNSSGVFEVYVQSFPDATRGQWKVSNSGGQHVRWSQNSNELYYLTPTGTLMAVPFEIVEDAFRPLGETALFQTRIPSAPLRATLPPYDVSPDGRFLMTVQSQSVSAPITLIQNWNPENTQ